MSKKTLPDLFYGNNHVKLSDSPEEVVYLISGYDNTYKLSYDSTKGQNIISTIKINLYCEGTKF